MDEIDSTRPYLTESDLLDPYERLVNVEILGKPVQVPEKNRLLRCFQFLSLNSISYGDFCWNGECTNCQIWYHEKGQTENNDKPVLSCRAEVSEGMVITKLSQFIHLDGINK
jgi:NADH dehydrogenase/NADH:ubiquinone oxidoreductase subunit G